MAPSSTPSPEMSPRCPRAMTPGWWETSRSSWWTGSGPATTRVPKGPGLSRRRSAEDDLADLRGSQYAVGRMPDTGQLNQPVPGGDPGRVGEPADVLVVVQAAVEA